MFFRSYLNWQWLIKYNMLFVSLGWTTNIPKVGYGSLSDDKPLIYLQKSLCFVCFGRKKLKCYLHQIWFITYNIKIVSFLGWATSLWISKSATSANFEFERSVYNLHENISIRLNKYLCQLCVVECPLTPLMVNCVPLDPNKTSQGVTLIILGPSNEAEGF